MKYNDDTYMVKDIKLTKNKYFITEGYDNVTIEGHVLINRDGKYYVVRRMLTYDLSKDVCYLKQTGWAMDKFEEICREAVKNFELTGPVQHAETGEDIHLYHPIEL